MWAHTACAVSKWFELNWPEDCSLRTETCCLWCINNKKGIIYSILLCFLLNKSLIICWLLIENDIGITIENFTFCVFMLVDVISLTKNNNFYVCHPCLQSGIMFWCQGVIFVKLRSNFNTWLKLYVLCLLLWILYLWPEDDPLRSKHVAALKVYTNWVDGILFLYYYNSSTTGWHTWK
jgi:hypothetical protein